MKRKCKDFVLIKAALKEAEEYYIRQRTSPTLRGLFYILVSKNVIPNTQSAYKKLSKCVAEARYYGEFPWYLIKDTTRKYYYLEKQSQYPTNPLSPEDLKRVLEHYINQYSNVTVNPWEDQKHRIVIVVEKEALGDVIMRFIGEVWPFGIYQVRVIRGYDSATDAYDIAVTIDLMPENITPVILHLGDFDPSGEDIARDLRERVIMLMKRKNVIFEKVAVTIDQIIELGLPANPESAEEVEKMRRDARYKTYIKNVKELVKRDPRVKKLIEEMYKTYEIRVELDALVALYPDKFKEILRRAIEKYFDWGVYEKVTKPKEEELSKKAEGLRRQSLESLSKLIGTISYNSSEEGVFRNS